MKLFLYTGPDCHLCELAKRELAELREKQIKIVYRNVKNHSDWYHKYAVRIPVLQREDNHSELNWPFSVDEIRDFIL